jgi:hypothetical protein
MWLFPNNPNLLENNMDKRYYIPQGDSWFALDAHPGKETFYLIASKNRLNNLENLIHKYLVSGIEEKSNIAPHIIQEIKGVKRMHKTFTAKAERPIQIGGSVRGLKDQPPTLYDITPLAVEITATNFYSRTFTIEHK